MPKPIQPFRTNVLLPRPLYRDLKRALVRRKAQSAARGVETTTKFSAWVREKAVETIAAYK